MDTKYILSKTEQDHCRCKANNTSDKCFNRSMTYWFIERFSIIGCEIIECTSMESCLKSHIHSIIDNNDGEYETDSELIAPYIMFDSHSRCKCYNKGRMCWWHTSTSEHIRYTEFSIKCMNNSLDNNREYKGCKWNNQCMFRKIWLKEIEIHTIWVI